MQEEATVEEAVPGWLPCGHEASEGGGGDAVSMGIHVSRYLNNGCVPPAGHSICSFCRGTESEVPFPRNLSEAKNLQKAFCFLLPRNSKIKTWADWKWIMGGDCLSSQSSMQI